MKIWFAFWFLSSDKYLQIHAYHRLGRFTSTVWTETRSLGAHIFLHTAIYTGAEMELNVEPDRKYYSVVGNEN
jgi:hypothetical protein